MPKKRAPHPNDNSQNPPTPRAVAGNERCISNLPPGENMATTSQPTLSRLVPTITPSTARMISNDDNDVSSTTTTLMTARGLENISSDESPLPPDYVADYKDQKRHCVRSKPPNRKINAGIEYSPTTNPPPPEFTSSQVEGGLIHKKKPHDESKLADNLLGRGGQSIPFIQASPIIREVSSNTINDMIPSNEDDSNNNGEDREVINESEEEFRDHSYEISPTINICSIDDESAPPFFSEDIVIPDAIAVEEDNIHPPIFATNEVIVAHAEPVIPWYKKKRFIFLILIVLLVIIALSTVVGVLLSPSNETSERPESIVDDSSNILTSGFNSTSIFPSKEPTASPTLSLYPTIFPTETPSSSIVPSTAPTQSPSLSQMPSLQPTQCIEKIYDQIQILGLQPFDPFYPNVAMDGNNAVLVTRSGHVVFYLLDSNFESNPQWRRTDTFQQELSNNHVAVALEGRVAVVGYTYAFIGDGNAFGDKTGAIFIYEQDEKTGVWEQIVGPITPLFLTAERSHYELFGYSLDVDGDFIAVNSPNENLLYIYQRNFNEGGDWSLFETLSPSSTCDSPSFGEYFAFHNGIIAIQVTDDCIESIHVYQYNPLSNSFSSKIQDPLIISDEGLFIIAIGLSEDTLVCSTFAGVSIFRQFSSNQTFEFVQYISVGEYEDGFGYSLFIRSDILLADGDGVVYIFRKVGYNDTHRWEEILQLKNPLSNKWPFGDSFAISERNLLISSRDEVYALRMEGCIQPPPT